jgi:hypothetical protein
MLLNEIAIAASTPANDLGVRSRRARFPSEWWRPSPAHCCLPAWRSSPCSEEDLRGIISAYNRRRTELIEHNGGFVAKYMGDGGVLQRRKGRRVEGTTRTMS